MEQTADKTWNGRLLLQGEAGSGVRLDDLLVVALGHGGPLPCYAGERREQ